MRCVQGVILSLSKDGAQGNALIISTTMLRQAQQ